MANYLFQLGHQPHISRAEIFSVLEAMNISYTLKESDKNHVLISSKGLLDATKLNQTLGGTIKIMEEISVSANLASDITNYLNRVITEGKINFSLSGSNAARIAITIKKNLKQLDRSVRYIEPKNTATILHNNLIKSQSDLTIVYNRVYVTRSIQLLEEFSERDYGRPNYDSKSGMLPPKLARMMINLSSQKIDAAVLDPFCGSGTILLEAIDLGFSHLIGSDISNKAIDDTTNNLNWFAQKKGLVIKPKLILSDVHTLGQKFSPKSIDAIVTEPFLGNPLRGHETKDQLTKSARELRGLYEDAFRIFSQILKPGGVIIFIIPEFYVNNEIVTVDCLSHIRTLGFKTVALDPDSDSLLYRRPGQFVGRRIWKFVIA